MEYDGYFGFVIFVIAKITPAVNHTCRFPSLHSTWLASQVTISQCWLVSLNKSKQPKNGGGFSFQQTLVGQERVTNI